MVDLASYERYAKLNINMKKILIVANWKMNPQSLKEAQELFDSVARGVKGVDDREVVICPPFVYLSDVKGQMSGVQLGAQDCFFEQKGAFTGEISPLMLKDIGCEYVILGHSERKNYLGETYEMINKKVKTALRSGLIPVVCIGEKERQGSNENRGELEQQMRQALRGVKEKESKNLVLCYEPEWAISSNPGRAGKGAAAAIPKDCAQAISYMRTIAKELFRDVDIPILYGGSTNSKNIGSFIQSGAQGALVGSASLDAQEFIQLVKNATA